MSSVKIDDEFLNGVAKFARYHHTPRQILILLDVPQDAWPHLLHLFDDPDSQVCIFYQKGQLFADQERLDSLDHMIAEGADGAGDAAFAISRLQKKHSYAELKKRLFGV